MIPFVDLKTQYAGIKNEVNAAIQGILDSCQFTLGSEVAAFEEEFASYCHGQHGIGVNTGTSALHLALLAAGIGPGDEVITVPFTFVATVAAIYYTGATPVFVDINPHTFTIDVQAIEDAITEEHQGHPSRASVWATGRHGSHPGYCQATRFACDRRRSTGSWCRI